jgi:flavin reductase (DIM6/NTAB) family NADH-FMN oxidoreductase RutF
MTEIPRHTFDHYPAVMDALTTRGLLLGSFDAGGRGNLMTIGWGSLGMVWGVPTWMVLVRPSRYTYSCIEHSGCFTVNVTTDEQSMACVVCGSQSGRDIDKFEETGLTLKRAASVLAPLAEECPIQYQCQVIHSNDVLPSKLTDEIRSGSYQDGDYHRVYIGKVLKTTVASDAAEQLADRARAERT